MIFRLDDSIRCVDLQKMADVMRLVSEKGHHLICSPIVREWIDSSILRSDQYIGKLKREEIRGNSSIWDITEIKRTYLRYVEVSPNHLTIDDMLTLLSEPSLIIVENSGHDGPVISKWIELYCDGKRGKYVNLNKLVLNSIKNGNLRFSNAGGGNGTIVNAFKALGRPYSNIKKEKVTTIYDSDKTSSSDSSHNNALNGYLSSNNIDGHELYKRELENYFEIDVYYKAGLWDKSVPLTSYSPGTWDFVDIEKNVNGVSYGKGDILILIQWLDKNTLSKRVKHHINNDIDEIQDIIFHLARYI